MVSAFDVDAGALPHWCGAPGRMEQMVIYADPCIAGEVIRFD
jgi:hypothetical protein